MGLIFKGQHEKSPTEALRSGGAEGIVLYLVPILADILSLLVGQAADLVDLFHFPALRLEQLDHEIHGTLVRGVQCAAGGFDNIFH